MLGEEVREPQAGVWGFYPIAKDRLLKQIERSFKDNVKGPGELPQKLLETDIEIIAGIVPHAGYVYSGSCASWFYKKLAESMPKIDVAIILGTNHTGFGGKITTTTYFKRWATPLGEVEVDLDFVHKLVKGYDVVDDMLAHMREHSVEVQIPFLQFLYDKFKLVPIVVREVDYEIAYEFAKVLHEVVSTSGKQCVVIASSDFTHHGAAYGYVIFKENVSENVRQFDLTLIDRILNLDTKGFLDMIYRYDATVCGYGAIAITIEYAKLMGCKAELLKYYHSGDVTGEEDMIVGYASISFYRKRAT